MFTGRVSTTNRMSGVHQILACLALPVTLAAVDREVFEKQAASGQAEAQYQLAEAFFWGRGGKQDLEQAADWARLSAEQGNAKAQAHLALMYLRGEGVTKDLVTGKAWDTIFDKNRLGAYEITDDVHITIDKGSRLIRKMTDAQYHKAERMAKDMIRRNPKLVNTI